MGNSNRLQKWHIMSSNEAWLTPWVQDLVVQAAIKIRGNFLTGHKFTNFSALKREATWTSSWISDAIVHFKKTQKKFFVNNSCTWHWNFSHRMKPWLCKYLLYCHLQIFIQGRVMLKNNSVYFLAKCANLEFVCVDILGTRFCFQGSH